MMVLDLEAKEDLMLEEDHILQNVFKEEVLQIMTENINLEIIIIVEKALTEVYGVIQVIPEQDGDGVV